MISSKSLLRMAHKVGWHIGNAMSFGAGQKSVLQAVPPACVTFIAGEGYTPEHMKWTLELNPGCHFIFRPYFLPNDNPTAYQNYLDSVASLIDQAVWDLIPERQRHLQIFNEQNMPRWSQWEGFGDTVDDMARFNDWFCRGYEQLKMVNPTFKIGWTPLTPGNRDAWFKTDPMNVPYYMHGPEAAKPNPSDNDIALAISSGPCYDSLMLADEYYAHIYVLNDASNQIFQPWGGLRFVQYAKFFPKPMDIWIPENGIGLPVHNWKLWYDLLDKHQTVKGTSIWILGHTIRSDGDPIVKFLRDYMRGKPEPPPEPEPEPPIVDPDEIEQRVREKAWDTVGVPYNPEAAFPVYARLEGLGSPLAGEDDVEVDGVSFRFQPYVGGVVFCKVGDWGNVTHIEW
jgi:hypothetical protein